MHRRNQPIVWLSLLSLLIFLIQPAPAAYAAVAVQRAGDGYAYTIRPDDTLWDIAVAHGITVAQLTAANKQLDPKRLLVGQTIFVPASPPVAAPPAPAAASAPETAPTETPPALSGALPAELSGWPEALLGAINEARAANGLSPLAWSPELAAAAQAHAEELAQRNRGSHVGADGSLLRERLARAGYAASWASENWANAQSPAHAFRFWWHEPPGADLHRRNILHARYTEIGIGIARGPWGYYFVADFGSR